jgi:hypothetical protein
VVSLPVCISGQVAAARLQPTLTGTNVNIRITMSKQVHDKATRLAERRGVNLAEVVVQAVEWMREEQYKGRLGLYDSLFLHLIKCPNAAIRTIAFGRVLAAYVKDVAA